MEKRNLINSVDVTTDELYGHEEQGFNLEYYMVETNDTQDNDFIYGVEIRKVKNGRVQEVVSEYQICRTYDRAKRFIDVLAKNTVTPSGLVDIIKDKEED